MKPTFTIGIEEEYQTIDPVTRDLRSHIHAEMIEKGKLLLQERVKSEMHQSVVEVGTRVCANIKDAKKEVVKLRRDMVTLAKENNLRLASAASWRVPAASACARATGLLSRWSLPAREEFPRARRSVAWREPDIRHPARASAAGQLRQPNAAALP